MKKQGYSTMDVARACGITLRTLYSWLKNGKVSEPARDRNNQRRWREEEFNKIVSYALQTKPARINQK